MSTDGSSGAGDDIDDIDDAVHLELEFLTSLIWAPDAMTTAAVLAIVGTPADRDPDSDHVSAARRLFLRPIHATLFDAIVARVDDGLPVTPTLLVEGVTDQRSRSALREVLLEIAAPVSRGPGPLPGGADVPHLAAALVDRWYRRGYAGLLSRMTLAVDEAPTADLSDHWSALTEHQRHAERVWTATRTRLAAL